MTRIVLAFMLDDPMLWTKIMFTLSASITPVAPSRGSTLNTNPQIGSVAMQLEVGCGLAVGVAGEVGDDTCVG